MTLIFDIDSDFASDLVGDLNSFQMKVNGVSFTLSSFNSYPLDKMAAILADNIFIYIFLNEIDKVLIQISLKLVPWSPINNKPALVQLMAWRQTGDKPLPDPMMTQFTWCIYVALGGDELNVKFS